MSDRQHNPTPDKIRQACLLIQSEWSPAEKLRRLRADLRPTVMTADGRAVTAHLDDDSERAILAGPSERKS